MNKQKLISYKQIWNISLPIILSLVAQNIVNITDTAFLGHVGEIELGASAIGGLFYISFYMLGFGFSVGTQILIGRRNGEKKFNEIGKIFDNSLYFLIILAFFVYLFIVNAAPYLLKNIIQSDTIYQASVKFLNIRVYGIVFAFITVLFRSLYIGITNTKILTYSAIIMAVVNIILDYLLIFGLLGFKKLGIEGAAYASVIAEFSSAIFLFIFTYRKIDVEKFDIFKFKKINVSIIKKNLNVSVFVMAQFFISLMGYFIFFMIIEKMGEMDLAISNIIRSIYLVFMVPVFAFSSTVNTLVSNAIGQKMYHHVIPIIKKVTILNSVIIAILALITAFVPRTIISIYSSNIEIINGAVLSFYVVISALLLFSFSNIIFNGVSGTANTLTALIIEIVTIIIYLAFAAFLALYLKTSIEIVWFSEHVYFMIIGALSFIYLKSNRWKNKII